MKILKKVIIIFFSFICLFGLKMILPVIDDESNVTNQNYIIDIKLLATLTLNGLKPIVVANNLIFLTISPFVEYKFCRGAFLSCKEKCNTS